MKTKPKESTTGADANDKSNKWFRWTVEERVDHDGHPYTQIIFGTDVPAMIRLDLASEDNSGKPGLFLVGVAAVDKSSKSNTGAV